MATEPRTWFSIRAKEVDPGEEDPNTGQDPNRPGYLEDEGPVAEVMIYDEIGAWGIGAAEFDRELKALGPDIKTINMRINSPGGDSFAGVAIYNMLNQHPAKITTRVDGIAASAASLIAMAGDRITMPENTFMVVHDPIALTYGPAATHRAMADDLDRVASGYATTYAARSGQTLEAVRSLMAQDRLMNAAECKERGYCDETTPAVQISASFALDRIAEKHRAALAPMWATAGVTSGGAGEPVADVVPVQDSPAAADPQPDTAPPEAAPEQPQLDEPELTAAPPPAAYGAAEITATIELCTLAGISAAAAQKFIAAQTPVAKVREQLLEARAAAGDSATIVPFSTNGGGGGADNESGALVVAGKRRLQAIIKRSEKDRISIEQATRLVDNRG